MNKEKVLARSGVPAGSYDRFRAGFGVAPILYMLGLIGVGAGVLFSSYSQSIKNNIVLGNSVSVRNDLESSTNTLAAISTLSQDGSKLCPPGFSSSVTSISDGVCIPADTASPPANAPLVPVSLDPLSAAAASKLPSPPEGQPGLEEFLKGAADVDVGVMRASAGTKQIDPWGHYYIVCRWASPTNNGPAFQILSAGPSGRFDANTYCGNNPSASSGNYAKLTDAPNATNRASIWQTSVGTAGALQASYSATGVVVDSDGNLTVPGNLNLTGSGKSVTLTNADLTITNGDLELGSGNATLSSGSFQVTAGSVTIGTSSITNEGDISARSLAVSGALSAATGSGTGPFYVDAAGNISLGPLGTPVMSVAADTGNATLAGTASIGSTLTVGTVSGTAVTSINTYGGVHIATTVLSSTSSVPYLSVGTPSGGAPVSYPFSVDQAGNMIANNITASSYGNVNATGISASGALTVTGTTTLGALTAGNATLGNVTASSYGAVSASSISDSGDATISGNLTVVGTINGIPGGGADLSDSIGVVAIEHGGTGYSSTNTLDGLLGYLGVKDAANLTLGILPVARFPVVYPSGDPAGTYNTVQVDQYGRVIAVSNTYPDTLGDSDNDSISLASNVITFTIDGTIEGVWDNNGLTIGSSSAARSTLDLGRMKDALIVPVGTSGDQPATPAPGMLRYNSTLNAFEGYLGSPAAWSQFATGQASQWITSGSNIYYSLGNVGIGTTDPAQKLHVNGPIMVGAGSCGATTSGSIQYSAGGDLQYCNGTAWITFASGSGGGNIIGIGTQKYIPVFTGTNTLGNSVLYQTGGFVGIGTTSPSGVLEVYGNSTGGVTRGDLVVDSANGTVIVGRTSTASNDNTTFSVLGRTGSVALQASYNRAGVAGAIPSDTTFNIATAGFATTNAYGLKVNVPNGATNNYTAVFLGGNVGIGTTSPSHLLNVVDSNTTANRAGAYISQTGAISGTGYGGYFIKTGASTTNVGLYTEASGATNNYGLIVGTGNVGIGTTAPSHLLNVVDSKTTANRAGTYVSQTGAISGTGYGGYFSKTGASTTNVGLYTEASGATNNYGLIVGAGNVGIGTTGPSYQLHNYINANSNLFLYSENAYSGAGSYIDVVANSSYAGFISKGSSQTWLMGQYGTTNWVLDDRTNSDKTPIVVEPNTASNTLYLKNTGNVGIGTTSPSYTLHVNSSGSAAAYAFTSAENGMGIGGEANTGAGAVGVEGYSLSGTGVAGYSDAAGGIGVLGQNSSASGYGGYFANTGGGYALIATGGNVGIGSTSPASATLVVGSGSDQGWSGNDIVMANANGAMALATNASYSFIKGSKALAFYGNSASVGLSISGANVTMPGFTSAGYVCTSAAGLLSQGATCSTSDLRLKKDILPLTSSLEKIASLRGVTFHWKDTRQGPKPEIGLIAQEVEKVYPEVVTTNSEGWKVLQYENLVAALIEAVKELKTMLDGAIADIRSIQNHTAAQVDPAIDTLKKKSDDQAEQIKELKTLIEKQKTDFDTYKKAHP